jgi:hypothetical protein
MYAIERVLVWLSLQVASLEQINAFFGSAQNTAIVLGALIALSGGMLGSFLLLREWPLPATQSVTRFSWVSSWRL